MKRSGVRQTIVERKKGENGKIIRVLECGHEQAEGRGGKVQFAEFAVCITCREVFDATLLSRRLGRSMDRVSFES